MAIQNGNYSFSVGRDIQLKLIGPEGEVDIDNILTFESKPEYADVKIDRLDGEQLQAALPKGWTGSFDLYRANAGLDRFFNEMAEGWHNNGVYNVGTVYAFVTEADGSQTVFQFTNCALKFDEAGSWEGDKQVKQKVSFVASRRHIR